MKKGKLIVIDGTDGSGKATQANLLIKKLKKEGFKVTMVDFPEYDKNFFGQFIAHCLRERYYDFVNVHPKIASVLYAADRFESSEKIRDWLSKGYIVIANRYVSSNQIHQGGKIKEASKRKNFLKWLDEMEHGVFKIPRPNSIFFLSVPIPITLKLMKERDKNHERSYLSKKDVHESDHKHLENARKSAIKLVSELNNFIKIDCVSKNQMRTREDIHEEIYEKVKKILKK